MPTAQASHYIALGDEAIGPFYHIESVSLEGAATVASATTSLAGANAISVWNANNHSATAEVLSKHPLAVWDSLSLKVSPGPGIFGRAVTLHLAWGQHNDPAPDSLAKLRQCWGYQRHTYGGASDPSVSERTIAAPFSASRSDILKTQSYHIGGRIQLFYIFTEASIGTVNADGPRFTFDLEGVYHVYGRN